MLRLPCNFLKRVGRILTTSIRRLTLVIKFWRSLRQSTAKHFFWLLKVHRKDEWVMTTSEQRLTCRDIPHNLRFFPRRCSCSLMLLLFTGSMDHRVALSQAPLVQLLFIICKINDVLLRCRLRYIEITLTTDLGSHFNFKKAARVPHLFLSILLTPLSIWLYRRMLRVWTFINCRTVIQDEFWRTSNTLTWLKRCQGFCCLSTYYFYLRFCPRGDRLLHQCPLMVTNFLWLAAQLGGQRGHDH